MDPEDLVLGETERLPCGEGVERALASSIRPKTRTTASTGVVCTDTRNLFCTNIQVYLHLKNYLSIG